MSETGHILWSGVAYQPHAVGVGDCCDFRAWCNRSVSSYDSKRSLYLLIEQIILNTRGSLPNSALAPY